MHVLFVHGVGLGPETFADAVDAATNRGHAASVHVRRGYDTRPPTDSFDQHLADLTATVDVLVAEHGPVVVAGVSGGATLALALAATSGERARHTTVVHEPLLGPLAVEQHDRVVASIEAFRSSNDSYGFEGFMRRLVTPGTWDQLSEPIRASARRHAPSARVEVRGFTDFSIGPRALHASARTTTWSIGTCSPPWRHDASAVGAAHGLQVRRVDACHTPQIESVDEWIEIIEEAAGACP